MPSSSPDASVHRAVTQDRYRSLRNMMLQGEKKDNCLLR
jgi:hypothetical protein